MKDIVEENGADKFAKGQSRRDLRVSDTSEQLTMEVLEMEASVQDLVNHDRVNAEIEVVNASLN